ncbi:hypothetical protein RFI_01827, partial [Reticulomyxa filosa]
LDKTPRELKLMSNSSNVDIVLFFWPDADSFTDIKRGNAASLFLRVLLEVCSTVCIKVSQSELDNFYVRDNRNEGEQITGGGIQLEMKEQQKNGVSYNVEEMQSFPIAKERKQGNLIGSVISKRAFAIEGAQSTIICHCSIQRHVIEPKPLQFTSSSKEELINCIKQITKTHQLKLLDGAFDTWEKAAIIAEVICPELIEVPTFFFLIDMILYTYICYLYAFFFVVAQQQYNSKKTELENDYRKLWVCKYKDSNLEELREIAKELSNEKINAYFSAQRSDSVSAEHFSKGFRALAQISDFDNDLKQISNNTLYNLLLNDKDVKSLDTSIKKLCTDYEKDLNTVHTKVKEELENKKKEGTEKDKEERKNNEEQSDGNKIEAKNSHKRHKFGIPKLPKPFLGLLTKMQLTEELKNRLADYDYSPYQIKWIAEFGDIYEYFSPSSKVNSEIFITAFEQELKKKIWRR